jgi:uncharacterized membrane protein
MKLRTKRMLAVAVVLLLVAGFMVQVSHADQHVICPMTQVQAGITSPLPVGWSQTPQAGPLVKTQVGNIGGQKMLMCGYKVYNTTAFLMRPFPEAFKVCRPAKDGFMCK